MQERAGIESRTDVAIVGAGPAGMAAAIEARRHGLSVTVLDDQPAMGGQILRGIAREAGTSHYEPWGAPLAEAFARSGARYLTEAAVWAHSDGVLCFGQNGRTRRLAAPAIILATGAMERPVVIPGHTLPGVMTVGGLQSLRKGSAVVPSGRYVLAGNGPLLLLTALQLRQAGAPPAALVLTTPRWRLIANLPLAFGLLGDPQLAKSGLGLMTRIRMAGIPVHRAARDLRVLGARRAEGLRFRAGGREVTIEADLVALHDGVVPNDHLAVSFGCASRWDPDARAYAMVTSEHVRSSQPGIWLAGDAATIAGGYMATLTGRLAGLDVARQAGAISVLDHGRQARPIVRERERRLAARRFVDGVFAPSLPASQAPGEALLCRCEEVRVDEVREAIAQGARGTRQLKTATRCGMGPCQGRQCTLSLLDVLASELGCTIGDLPRPSLRVPGRPITVAELAASHYGHQHSGSDA